jgi:hypothetical protein
MRTVIRTITLFVLSFRLGTSDGTAGADLIQPSSVVASSEFSAGFNGLAINTINGSGLPAGFGPADSHAAYASGNHWTTDGTDPTGESITWSFASPENIDAIHIWNHQSTTGVAINSGYDVTLYDLTLLDTSSAVIILFDDVA